MLKYFVFWKVWIVRINFFNSNFEIEDNTIEFLNNCLYFKFRLLLGLSFILLRALDMGQLTSLIFSNKVDFYRPTILKVHRSIFKYSTRNKARLVRTLHYIVSFYALDPYECWTKMVTSMGTHESFALTTT
jgi:hypothetical protein